MLEPAMFIGLGVVAVWAYVRYPKVRPTSLRQAALHVAISLIGFVLLPVVLGFLLPLAQAHALKVSLALGLLFSAMTYLLLSWVWLIGRILHDLGGNPRGGHPISAKS